MLSDRIKEQRENKELSQKQLAQYLSVTQQTVASWESNRTRPDNETNYRLAQYFGVSTEELLYGKLGASIQRLTLARKLVGISNLAHASGIPVELVELYALAF